MYFIAFLVHHNMTKFVIYYIIKIKLLMTTSDYIDLIIKTIILISILNVWLVKYDKPSRWRGGGADSLQQEFYKYGLSKTMFYIVGFIKIALAIILFVSAFFMSDLLEPIGAYGMAIMMLGAIIMHVRISDPISRNLPAFIFLILSLATLYV
jgi:hypothetical protein